ncbi:hypothetical protein PAXRUDRAFT_795623 [Paxillus rubicundulus Ve08.2h10]|uniref:Phosphatidylserine decarboxylase proenzyme 1, mitochondrial n=1 Tax=Paxillus rubicundulus Ve08.2h10 TaxID=930991 RepID=A0A0D0DYS1_9AGAM|nr:hypothetical protein PAXRUDRAFT_795623 [Paxillus rubicundulus Ve08.2h10]
MLYKAIVTGKRPLQAASRAISSTTSAAANTSSAIFSRVFVKRRISLSGTQLELPGASSTVPLYNKLVSAWTQTPTKWYPLPLAVGALLLVMIRYHKKSGRAEKEVHVDEEGHEVIKLKGPWQVHVMSALPLRNMSRVWGYMNSFELPIWIRPYGFRFYAYAFGCNLEEIEPSDLTKYANLGQFFNRQLKAGARPVDNVALVSPADGTVTRCGTIDNLHIEQVKGITYSLDALLGVEPSDPTPQETLACDKSLGVRKRSISGTSVRDGNSLYFTVIYLAPGDYHRFHSPTAWVVEKRRHFVGKLFSVSPHIAKRLKNLFVLNERVAFLGRWKYGFFGMIPVGATNVGSIKVNFDLALRTNVRGRLPPPGTYTEDIYSEASPLLKGHPLTPAQEMGGFYLGSTIVLVFEAPKTFEFAIKAGQKVKVGNRLGDVPGDFTTAGKQKTE